MKLSELKQELLKDPDFKKEYERFDLLYKLEMLYLEARMILLGLWEKLTKKETI